MLGEETDTIKCPAWYPLVQAAKYLNTTPWEMLEVSVYWKEKALIAMTAESEAQDIKSKH